MDKIRTEISSIGEYGLIDKLKSDVHLKVPSSLFGIGDDAAVVDCGSEVLLLSTDMLLEGIHFDLSYFPLKHLGYKAISVNVSDIAAMNGIPTQVVVSIGISNRFAMEAVEELYRGIRLACEDYNVDLVGGDTSSSLKGLFISVSILGKTKKGNEVYRSGAQNKDIICVSGDLGGAYIGLQILNREKEVYMTNPNMQPQLSKYEYVVGRQLKPKGRMDIIHELTELDIRPTAMIDISDGLASELLLLSKNSKKGMRIFEDKIPIDNQTFSAAVELKINPHTCALNGGEDYELLFTIRQLDYEKIKNHYDIHFIGYVNENPENNELVSSNSVSIPLVSQGWSHFNNKGN